MADPIAGSEQYRTLRSQLRSLQRQVKADGQITADEQAKLNLFERLAEQDLQLLTSEKLWEAGYENAWVDTFDWNVPLDGSADSYTYTFHIYFGPKTRAALNKALRDNGSPTTVPVGGAITEEQIPSLTKIIGPMLMSIGWGA